MQVFRADVIWNFDVLPAQPFTFFLGVMDFSWVGVRSLTWFEPLCNRLTRLGVFFLGNNLQVQVRSATRDREKEKRVESKEVQVQARSATPRAKRMDFIPPT